MAGGRECSRLSVRLGPVLLRLATRARPTRWGASCSSASGLCTGWRARSPSAAPKSSGPSHWAAGEVLPPCFLEHLFLPSEILTLMSP